MSCGANTAKWAGLHDSKPNHSFLLPAGGRVRVAEEHVIRPDWAREASAEAERATLRLGLPLARVPQVRWNPSLRTVAGRYLGRANLIELNPHYCRAFGLPEVIATVRHEVCHIGLRAGSALKHNTDLFARRLARISAPNHCLPLKSKIRRSRVRYAYRCPACAKTVTYRREVKDLACRDCCDRESGGAYDRRFRLRLVARKVSNAPARRPALREADTRQLLLIQ